MKRARKGVLVLTLGLGWLTVLSSKSEAQPIRCAWSFDSIPVYFDPQDLAKNGFVVDDFRSAMIDAIAVWNAESDASYKLYYAGETTVGDYYQGTTPPNAITVTHQDPWFCGMNEERFLAKAFGRCTSGIIRIILTNTCTGQTRNWTTGWASPSEFSYEAVMVHEFGHSLGFADNNLGDSVMNGNYAFPGYLYIYDADRSQIIGQKGRTKMSPAMMPFYYDSSGTIGFNPSAFHVDYPRANLSTFPPALGTHSLVGDPKYALSDEATSFLFIENTAGTNSNGLRNWNTVQTLESVSGSLDLATSQVTDETLVVEKTQCNRTQRCKLKWLSYRPGLPVATGVFDGVEVYGRAAVAIDEVNQRFVLFFGDGRDGVLHTTSRDVEAGPGGMWSPKFDTGEAAVRHMGGAVFDNDEQFQQLGLFMAAVDESDYHKLYQYEVIYAGGGDYAVGPAFEIHPSEARTRRPFSLAYDAASQVIFVAWRDTGFNQVVAFASKQDMDSSVPFSDTVYTSVHANNGVDVALDSLLGTFMVGFAD